jgi:hypothetical protein
VYVVVVFIKGVVMNAVKQFVDRLGIDKWPPRKKIILGIAGFIALFAILFAVSLYQVTSESGSPRVNLLPRNKKPAKDLSYDFIKLDTLRMPTFPRAEQPQEPAPRVDNTYETPKEPVEPKKKTKPRSTPPQQTPPSASITYSPPPATVNKNPNMIVMNNMQENQVHNNGLPGGRLGYGSQSALVKVVLPDKIPVANGSVVVARVLRDSKWGDIDIPRRTKVIGIASLFANRVNIEFREIVINDTSRSCNGRAYDLKQLEGLAYSPVNSETREILMEELRNATTGIPVVGSVTSRATLSNNLVREVAELDEGLEFYVLITSIL